MAAQGNACGSLWSWVEGFTIPKLQQAVAEALAVILCCASASSESPAAGIVRCAREVRLQKTVTLHVLEILDNNSDTTSLHIHACV